ncbi:MAG TPA: GNAT family N-acetyltransferase [Mycobacteriales bacterium]|nr:GNAT family N-acetyltransferase [Mycobacteriales bacterium]
MEIVRVVPNRDWHALEDDVVVGRAYLRRRPDDRAFVGADAWQEDVTAALLDAVIADVPGELHSSTDENDAGQLTLLERAGFGVHRREDEFVLPVAAAAAATAGPVPDGIRIVPADEKESDRLARLDDRLRQDVPGTDGWLNESAEFREYTFGPHFDPEIYLVAMAGDEYAGLVRMWRAARVPRLGLIAVLRWHRRRGIARALLGQAFGVLAERGVEQVTTEADVTNAASQTLLAGLGAVRTGGSIELRRPG